MIHAFVADWWWACRWPGASVLGTGLVLGAAVAYSACRDRWRDRRTPRCRYCLTDLTLRNTHFRYGHLCGACGYAWESRARSLPREVMG